SAPPATASYLSGSLAARATCAKPAARSSRTTREIRGSPRNCASALSLPNRRLSPPARITAHASRTISSHPIAEDPLQRRGRAHQIERELRVPLRVPVSDRQAHVLAGALRAEGGRGERSGHAEEEDLAAVACGEDARHLGAGNARAVHHQIERTTRLCVDLER